MEDDALGAHPVNAAPPASAAPASAAPDKKLRRLIPLVSFNMIPSSFNNRTMRQKTRGRARPRYAKRTKVALPACPRR
ncbi:MAG: hypothetical protein ACLTQI_09450 [Slackia sp.]